MKAKYRIGLAGLVGLISGIGLSTPANAQPRGVRDEHRINREDDRIRHEEVRHEEVRREVIDHRLAAARLQALEDARERERAARIRDERAWELSREERAAAHRRELMEQWGGVAIRSEARAELELHAERMAHLNRILDVANAEGDVALANHCRAVIQHEIARNARVMARISAGGAP